MENCAATPRVSRFSTSVGLEPNQHSLPLCFQVIPCEIDVKAPLWIPASVEVLPRGGRRPSRASLCPTNSRHFASRKKLASPVLFSLPPRHSSTSKTFKAESCWFTALESDGEVTVCCIRRRGCRRDARRHINPVSDADASPPLQQHCAAPQPCPSKGHSRIQEGCNMRSCLLQQRT